MSYDVLEVPIGYRTDLVLLLAPYFDSKFIKTLIKKLAPEKLRVVIDDGVRAEDIQQLIRAADGTSSIKFALAAAAGLFHIKGYYAEFVKANGRSRRRQALPMRPTQHPAVPHGAPRSVHHIVQTPHKVLTPNPVNFLRSEHRPNIAQ